MRLTQIIKTIIIMIVTIIITVIIIIVVEINLTQIKNGSIIKYQRIIL